jgi:hypothetical protein
VQAAIFMSNPIFKFHFLIQTAITILILGCGQAFDKQDTSSKTIPGDNSIYVDSTLYTIIPFKKNWFAPFDTSYGTAKLRKSDIIQIEKLLTLSVSLYNNRLVEEVRGLRFIDILKGNYKRQYIPVINKKGETEVWINCLCDPRGDEWKVSISHIKDGGKCYFQLVINLSTGECSELGVNGDV